MLDMSSISVYLLTTREDPYSVEALYPPHTNREQKGWKNTSFSSGVTKFSVPLMFHDSYIFSCLGLDCNTTASIEMKEYNIKILWLNVNGLNNPVKPRKVTAKLRKDKSQIINLQETHLSLQESEKLKRFGCTNTFYSSFSHGCRRGVTKLVHNSLTSE